MLRISWTEKKPNVSVLREGNVQRSLLKTIRKRQMEFLGHVCRRRGLEFLSLTGKVEGKRYRGKQRITFLDSLCNSTTGGQSKGLNSLKLSDDRDVWRGMAANVPDLAADDDDDVYSHRKEISEQEKTNVRKRNCPRFNLCSQFTTNGGHKKM